MAKIIRFRSLESSGPITANNGTITTSTPLLTLSQTWDALAQTFHLCTIGITNSTPWTASAADSTLFRVQYGSVNAFSVGYTGNVTASGTLFATVALTTNGSLQLSSNVSFRANTSQALDTWTAGALDVRLWSVGNPVNAATNFERLFLRGQTSAAFLIGTEKGGTGVARDLAFQTDGTTRMTLGATTGTLTINNGTITTSTPVLDLSQTWNNAAVTFTSLRLSVTNTASGASSLMTDFRVGGVTIFSVQADGTCICNTFNSGSTPVIQNGFLTVANSSALRWYTSSQPTTQLWSGGNDTLEMRRGTNGQIIRIYRTYTDASNYERGFLRWNTTTNILELGVEAAGTGSVRNVRIFTTASNNYVALGSSSLIGFGINGDNAPAVIVNGFERAGFSASGITLSNDSTTGIRFSGGPAYQNDTILQRDAAAGALALISASGPSFRIYNVTGTNYERLSMRWTTNEFIIDTQIGGTGTLRGIKLGSASTSLLGFYGATPVDRPDTVSDPTGGTTIDSEARTAINTIIDRLQELGLIA